MIPDGVPATKETPWGPRLRFALTALLALGPVVAAAWLMGRVHPDEVFQWLEPAHRVGGFPAFLPWEWEPPSAARNWVGPGILGYFLRAGRALGWVSPVARRFLVAIPIGLLHIAAVVASARYFRRRVDERPVETSSSAAREWRVLAALTLAFTPIPVLVYTGRTLSESLSTDALLIAFALLDGDAQQRHRHQAAGRFEKRPPVFEFRAVLGGFSAGMAVILRYPSLVLVPLAFLPLLLRGHLRALGSAMVGALLATTLLGYVEYAAWEGLFPSLKKYVEFNVLTSEGADRFGSAPNTFYLDALRPSIPLWVFAGAAVAAYQWVSRLRRKITGQGTGFIARWTHLLPPAPLTAATVYVGILLRTPHKEARFLYPALVLVLWTLAPTAVRALANWQESACLGAPASRRYGVTAIASSIYLGALGSNMAPRHLETFPLRMEEFRAVARVTALPETRGVSFCDEGFWGGPGGAYLGGGHYADGCASNSAADADRIAGNPDVNRVVLHAGVAHRLLLEHGFRDAFVIGDAIAMVR